MSWDEKARAQADLMYPPPSEMSGGTEGRIGQRAWNLRAGFEAGAYWQRQALLSDETVERAARALYAEIYRNVPGMEFDRSAEDVQDEYRRMARAALEAAIGDDDD